MSEQKLENRFVKLETKRELASAEGNLALPRVERAKEGAEPAVLTSKASPAQKSSAPLKAVSFGSPLGVERTSIQNEQKVTQSTAQQERMVPGAVTSIPPIQSRSRSAQQSIKNSSGASAKRERTVVAEKRSRETAPISILDRAARFIERMVKRLVRAVIEQLSGSAPTPQAQIKIPPVKIAPQSTTLTTSPEFASNLTLDLELSALRPRTATQIESQSELAAPVINSDDEGSNNGDSDSSSNEDKK